jgi:predicted transcriptional regulator
VPEESTISFEDPEDLLELLRSDNLALFRAIKEHPDSIASLAERLVRGQEAVRCDINELAKLGIVTITLEQDREEVRLTAQKFNWKLRSFNAG